MRESPNRLADAFARVLREEFGRSPAVRDLLVLLAEFVLAEAEGYRFQAGDDRASESPVTMDAKTDAETLGAAGVPAAAETTEVQAKSVEPNLEGPLTTTVPLKLGGPVMDVNVMASASDITEAQRAEADASDDDLPPQQEPPKPNRIDLGLVEERARLKAESCRFFIERRRDRGDPVREPALKARMDAMIATAKSMPDCFLWVLWPHQEQVADDRLLEIAACYDALAESVALCARAVATDGRFSEGEVQQAFQLLAEATSALRASLGVTWLTSDDIDQEETHIWLRRESLSRGVFVERYMKIDDPASPEGAGEVITEAKRLIAMEEARLKRSRKVDQLLNKAVYHARRIRNDAQPDRHDFETINWVMEELRTSGIGPTNARVAEFRESIEGIEFPPDMMRHEHLSFESRRIEARSTKAGDNWSDRVAEVRLLLNGGRIVIIGGEPRQDAISRLESAFGVTVEWVELAEHGSSARIKAPIERPNTRVVLLLIKLTGHLHADEARECARSASVPCVNIEAGYNPNMVAEQVLAQARERLSSNANGETGSA